MKTSFLTRLATGRNVLILLALYLLFPLFFLPSAGKALQEASGQADYQPLDLRPGFSPDEAWQALEVLGPDGRQSYLRSETIMDVAYPLTYGFFFALLISFLFQKIGRRFERFAWLAWMPLAAMLFDFLENMGIVNLIHHFPERADGWAQLASIAGIIKFAFFGLGVVSILAGLIGWVWVLFKKRAAS